MSACRGAVIVDGALVCCEEHDREPCPHDPSRRCAACPGGSTKPAPPSNPADLLIWQRAELLTWRRADTDKPDSDITVLCWDGETPFFCGYWDDDTKGWIGCESGGSVLGVTHWAKPSAPTT